MINKECLCKKTKCERHGNCIECRAFHAASKRKRPVFCERGKQTVMEEGFNKEVFEGIKQEENAFPMRFASYECKPYGVLFYMEENKDSYDGNHAVLYPEKIENLSEVLDEIRNFYGEKCIHASIYHPFVADYFKDNEKILNEHGFRYTEEKPHRVMLLTAQNMISSERKLTIKVLKKWDERVASDILIPSDEPWEVEVTRKRIARKGSYLFVGYLGKKAVVYSDIHVSEYGNTRFDYVVTAKEERNHGYASELIGFMADYCRKKKLLNCWQWAGPSEHICYQAGFREVATMEAGYAGICDSRE